MWNKLAKEGKVVKLFLNQYNKYDSNVQSHSQLYNVNVSFIYRACCVISYRHQNTVTALIHDYRPYRIWSAIFLQELDANTWQEEYVKFVLYILKSKEVSFYPFQTSLFQLLKHFNHLYQK